MKLYRTTYTDIDTTTDTWTTKTVWHGSADAASKNRTALKAADKLSKPSTDTVEIPTNKEGLLAWLNGA